jgi:hypothetical protein
VGWIICLFATVNCYFDIALLKAHMVLFLDNSKDIFDISRNEKPREIHHVD